LYLDEDAMRKSPVFALRARNVDIETASEAGMINRADEDHLAYPSSASRVLYSFNVADYCSIHQAWIAAKRPHSGIIVASQQRYPIAEELRRLTRLIGNVSAEGMENRIEFLSAWS
jgi:hypothetical protein